MVVRSRNPLSSMVYANSARHHRHTHDSPCIGYSLFGEILYTHEKQQKQKSQLVRLIDSSAISLAFIRLLQKCMEFWMLAFRSKTFDLGWELEPQSLLSSKCTDSKISILKRPKMAKFQSILSIRQMSI